MRRRGITPKVGFFLFVACGIAICFIGGPNALWHHDYRLGAIYLSLGMVLTVVFFRKRLLILVIIILVFILVNAGVTLIFHPSVLGLVFTGGSGVALYLLIVWDAYKHPELQGADWRKIYFGE